MSKTTITCKYLKDAEYNSKLFKVVEHNPHKKLLKFIKVWEESKLIYLKDKYLDQNKESLEVGKYYKLRLYFDEFMNKEGKEIMYICKIRYKEETDYKEKNTFEYDSDF